MVTFSIKKMEGSNKAHIERWSKLEKVSSIMYVCAGFVFVAGVSCPLLKQVIDSKIDSKTGQRKW